MNLFAHPIVPYVDSSDEKTKSVYRYLDSLSEEQKDRALIHLLSKSDLGSDLWSKPLRKIPASRRYLVSE
jgi:hypothetical protein